MLKRLAITLAVFAAPISLADTPRQATVVYEVNMRSEDPRFGGLSGIELSEDGQSGWIVGDRAHLFEIQIERGANGDLRNISFGATIELTAQGDFEHADTEGLALTENGFLVVSLEGPSRVWSIDLDSMQAKRLSDISGNPDTSKNAGAEAVAAAQDGHLIAILEGARGIPLGFPVFEFDGQGWRKVGSIPKQGSFAMVGADIGPDGQLYVLERAASMLGFRTRVRRFAPEGPFDTGAILYQSALGQHDNLEGMAAWRDPAGRIRLTLVSDDNFLRVLRTQLIELIVPE